MKDEKRLQSKKYGSSRERLMAVRLDPLLAQTVRHSHRAISGAGSPDNLHTFKLSVESWVEVLIWKGLRALQCEEMDRAVDCMTGCSVIRVRVTGDDMDKLEQIAKLSRRTVEGVLFSEGCDEQTLDRLIVKLKRNGRKPGR